MEKGKMKKEEKYVSLILVPHTTEGVRPIKLTALYWKLAAAGITFIVLLTILISTVIYTSIQNRKLSSQVNSLVDRSITQQKLINQKASEVSKLSRDWEMIDEKIQSITEKYREITNSYISSRSRTLTNRSGESLDRSFLREITNLKEMLKSINEVNKPDKKITSDLSGTERKLNKFIDSVPSIWPVYGRISSGYGTRKDPFLSKSLFHEGIDIVAKHGTPIRAAADGTVIATNRDRIYGLQVIISHGNGLKTLYGHVSQFLVKEGQTVRKGDNIARVGNTGRSTGTHLHYSVFLYDNPVNPHKYIIN